MFKIIYLPTASYVLYGTDSTDRGGACVRPGTFRNKHDAIVIMEKRKAFLDSNERPFYPTKEQLRSERLIRSCKIIPNHLLEIVEVP